MTGEILMCKKNLLVNFIKCSLWAVSSGHSQPCREEECYEEDRATECQVYCEWFKSGQRWWCSSSLWHGLWCVISHTSICMLWPGLLLCIMRSIYSLSVLVSGWDWWIEYSCLQGIETPSVFSWKFIWRVLSFKERLLFYLVFVFAQTQDSCLV